jgi:hypothetical protein
MSQNDFNLANQGFPQMRADMNSAFQALASNSSGATAPGTTYAYQFWYDTATNLLKMSNADNNDWITLAAFDQTTDEWELRSAVIQAVDSAGVVIKTDDGTTRVTVADSGNVTLANDLVVTGTVTVSGQTNTAAVLPSADATNPIGGASNRYTNLFLSGGVYLGGTGSANLLADYEEGTWTPSNTGTATISASVGRYTKVGRLVTAEFELTYNSSGSATVGGLPFTVSSDDRSIGAGREDNTGGLMWQVIATPSSTNAGLQNYINSATVVSGDGVRGTLTYYID